jgi:hypothetical protein
MFFIPLERSRSVDVQNGLAWAIWTSAAQVMVKRRVGSQTVKVENWPDPNVYRWSATHCWKALDEGYKFTLDLVLIRGQGEKLWAPKVSIVQTEIISGTPLWESREKVPSECKCSGETQRILYGGRWWLPPTSGHGESNESKVTRGFVLAPRVL